MRRLLKNLLKWLSRDTPEKFVREAVVLNVTIVQMPNSTHISNSVVGALNVSGQQAVHSIEIKIGALSNNSESREIAEALKELTGAIASNANALTEQQRLDALQQLEFLADQASVASNQRNRGMIGAAVSALAEACGAAGGLATAWQTWGLAIKGYFGM